MAAPDPERALRARIASLEEENEALRQRLETAAQKANPYETIRERWPHLRPRPSGVAILAELLRHEGRVVPHDRLMQAVWDHKAAGDWPGWDTTTLRVQVYNLRKALKRDGYADAIEPEWGIGYVLNRAGRPT
jgi:DNA-binding response OmpR family regulator